VSRSSSLLKLFKKQTCYSPLLSALLVIVGSFLALGQSVVSLSCFVVNSSLHVVQVVCCGCDPVSQGRNLGIKVGDLGIVLVHVLVQQLLVAFIHSHSLFLGFSFQGPRLIHLLQKQVAQLDDLLDQCRVAGIRIRGHRRQKLEDVRESLSEFLLARLLSHLAEMLVDLGHHLRLGFR
jgi:hypothetical protein